VKQSNENTKLTQAIERMRKLLAELSDRIDAEKDQDKKAIMIKTYHEYLKKFENEL
jgi:signal transduction protein with GAF and PtsI domain